MELFPGRTLEELDNIDINRVLRAIEARRLERLEARRQLFLAGKVKADSFTPAEWETIREMDALA